MMHLKTRTRHMIPRRRTSATVTREGKLECSVYETKTLWKKMLVGTEVPGMNLELWNAVSRGGTSPYSCVPLGTRRQSSRCTRFILHCTVEAHLKKGMTLRASRPLFLYDDASFVSLCWLHVSLGVVWTALTTFDYTLWTTFMCTASIDNSQWQVSGTSGRSFDEGWSAWWNLAGYRRAGHIHFPHGRKMLYLQAGPRLETTAGCKRARFSAAIEQYGGLLCIVSRWASQLRICAAWGYEMRYEILPRTAILALALVSSGARKM